MRVLRHRKPFQTAALLVEGSRRLELISEIVHLPSMHLSERQVFDLELLLSGAFSPLDGYLTESDYESVLKNLRLANGQLWPIPITLSVDSEFADTLQPETRLALHHPEGQPLAVLTVKDVYCPDKSEEAQLVFQTLDPSHPGVRELLEQKEAHYVGGTLEGIALPPHHTFLELRHSPRELQADFESLGWKRIIGFQTRNPLHRAHVELLRRSAERVRGQILLHPVVGHTNPGDLDAFVRVRCYEQVLQYLPRNAKLSLLPLAMRMAGPREALWHALIRRNHGCTHFVVGRDHAGPRDARGQPFYAPYEAQELAKRFESEMNIEILDFEEMVYSPGSRRYIPVSQSQGEHWQLSGSALRRCLQEGAPVPEWFSFPEVIEELRKLHPLRLHQGFTVFLTGLSGAGKSTIAKILVDKLMESGTRPVTLLDGDLVRKTLSSELGFSRKHRDLNIQRLGFVAKEITKNRGVAVCAAIAPYTEARQDVRAAISTVGGFIEVHVATPLDVCEARDCKGLYAKARAGVIQGFTGIDDPYQEPVNPELVLDTSEISAADAAQIILDRLAAWGYLAAG